MSKGSTTIQDLVYTTSYVEGTLTLQEVRVWFQTQLNIACLGVVNNDGFGLITRSAIYQIIAGGQGSAGAAGMPISDFMITDPFIVECHEDVGYVMEKLMADRGNEETFFNDIIVTDRGGFVGLVAVRDLIVHHMEALVHRLTAMEAQQNALARKNKELFANSFQHGQAETQYKSIFDMVPVPLVLFDMDGRWHSANPRFLRLGEYVPGQVTNEFYFDHLLDGDFGHIIQSVQENWQKGNTGDDFSYFSLQVKTISQNQVPVECVGELSPDGTLLMLSVVDVGGQRVSPQTGMIPTQETASPSEADHLNEVERSTRGDGGSKITQAIRTKLADSNAMGLARSVASNLIDKENALDKMMKKLETVIQVAEQIESTGANTQIIKGTAEEDLAQKMTGDLSEFSIVDLSQILIQGTKTGHLVIKDAHTKEVTGEIYFYCGAMVHAVFRDGTVGEPALYYIMGFREGLFEFIFDASSPEQTIQGDGLSILMEACRQMDESGS